MTDLSHAASPSFAYFGLIVLFAMKSPNGVCEGSVIALMLPCIVFLLHHVAAPAHDPAGSAAVRFMTGAGK